jgi:hypothetical protein
MEPRFRYLGRGTSAPGSASLPLDDTLPDSLVWREDRACCCPAQPLVRVIMPPTPERPYSVDLLLCGHHYRISRQAVAVAQARVENLPGKGDAAAAALLESVQRDHAEVG